MLEQTYDFEIQRTQARTTIRKRKDRAPLVKKIAIPASWDLNEVQRNFIESMMENNTEQ